MTDPSPDVPPKSPVEAAVEAAVETFVYAPIGLLFEGASLFPQLVEKGRNQVTMARMVGRFAVEQAGGEAVKAAGKLQDQAAGMLDFLGDAVAGAGSGLADGTAAGAPSRPAPVVETAAATKTSPASKKGPRTKTVPSRAPGAARQAARRVAGVASTTPTTTTTTSRGAATKPSAKPTGKTTATATPTGTDAVESTSLAIPDYDGLSASQVVNRLAGLSPIELESVRLYESAHRSRKTILSKVAQLQSAS